MILYQTYERNVPRHGKSMSQTTIKRIHLAYGIVLSLLVITLGVLLIASCLDIYHSGPRPFSTESVSEHFAAIALPFYLCLIWVLGGFVLSIALPLEKSKLKAHVSPEITLSRLSGKLDMERCPEELAQGIRDLRKWRLILTLVNTVFFLVGATLALIYALNKNNFPAADGQFNAEILHGTLKISRYLVLPFLSSIAVSLANHEFRKREIALTKEAIALCAAPPALCRTSGEVACDATKRLCPIKKITSVFAKREKEILLVTRCAVLLIGLAFVIVGIVNGGMADVVQKAIKICTECIGLG